MAECERGILDWLKDVARLDPEAPALVDRSGGVVAGFATLAHRVETLAEAFRGLGIGRDTRVAVCLKDGPDALIVLLALMSTAVVLPVHPLATQQQLDARVDALGVSVFVGEHRPASAAWQVAQARDLTYVAVDFDGAFDVASDPVSDPGHRWPDSHLTPYRGHNSPRDGGGVSGLDDPCLLISTSGTTGQATVVAITQRSLDCNVATHGRLNGHGPQTRAVSVMNFTYLFAYVRAALPILRYGGAVAVLPGYRFADMRICCDRFQPTFMAATPTILQKFMEDADRWNWRPPTGALGRFHATGEAIPDTLRDRLAEVFGAQLGTNYGMTEVSPQVAIRQPEDRLAATAAGRVVAPWQVSILAEGGQALPCGEIGRIALSGGYVNALVGQRGATRYDGQGRFLTGDRGFVDADGVLHVVGRADDVINRGGEKLDPREIERALEADPDVVRAVVFGVPDARMGHRVRALVVLREGSGHTAETLRSAVAARVAGWGLPERIDVVSQLPANQNGKISRRDLARRYADG